CGVQIPDAKREKGRVALHPNCSFASNLHFGISGKRNFFSPLVRSVPQKLIASIQALALAFDLHVRLHLKRRQVEDVGLRDSLLASAQCLLWVGTVGRTQKREKQGDNRNKSERVTIHG